MMAGPDGDSIAIENGPHIMRVDAVEHKREHADFFPRRSDQSQALDRAKHFRPVNQQLMLVSGRAVDSDLRHVFQRCAESDCTGNMRRSRLELVGQFVINRLLESDRTDHVAAGLIRRHLLEQVLTAVQNPNARRAKHLMA